MVIMSLFPLIIPGMFLLFVTAERIWPARPLPQVRHWRLKGSGFFLLAGLLSTTVPALYFDWIRAHRLMNLERLGPIGGALLGLVVVELVNYSWHWLRHRSPLWRVHQLHHSAERMDVFGASYFHPLDVISTNFVGAVVTSMILGLDLTAVALVSLSIIALAMFQHSNLRTPRWLGYLVQRPESHSVHHARGVHAFNYGNLPLWDMVFGTFRNPDRFEAETGFYDGASRRLGAMLVGRDVTRVRG